MISVQLYDYAYTGTSQKRFAPHLTMLISFLELPYESYSHISLATTTHTYIPPSPFYHAHINHLLRYYYTFIYILIPVCI